MNLSVPISVKSSKYSQDGKAYKIDLIQSKNTVIFSVKDMNEIDRFYKLELGFEDIQNKNLNFRIYKNTLEFINALKNFVSNKNVSFGKKEDSLIFKITNKDEIIKKKLSRNKNGC